MITKLSSDKDLATLIAEAGGHTQISLGRNPEIFRALYGLLRTLPAKHGDRQPVPARIGHHRIPEMPKRWLERFALHMTTQLRQVAQQSTIQRTNYQPKGALDRRRLTHALTGTSEFVRYRQDRTRGIDLAIYLSLDFSGSMATGSQNLAIHFDGNKVHPSLAEIVLSTNYAIRQVAFHLGFDHKCIGWGGASGANEPRRTGDVAIDKLLQDNPVLPYYVGMDFPDPWFAIKVVNSWQQPKALNYDAMLAAMSTVGGGTPIQHAYPLAFEELRRSPRFEKHLIVFTDGQAGGRYGHTGKPISNQELYDQYGDIAQALRRAHNVHTHTISLSARPPFVEAETLQKLGWVDYPRMKDVVKEVTQIVSNAIRSTSHTLR